MIFLVYDLKHECKINKIKNYEKNNTFLFSCPVRFDDS